MSWKTKMDQWLKCETLDAGLKDQLLKIQSDDKLLEDSFYKELEFGTGGMRGIIGPGTNRMNVYTVRKAAEGLANYIVDQGEEAMTRGIVIAHDPRHMSAEFALEVAKVAGKHGIQAYLFDDLRPTPVLSFAVRYLHAFAGVMITASHNPPEYNGLKMYGEDGCQLPPGPADEIIEYVQRAGNELEIEAADKDELIKNGLLTYIGEKVDNAYTETLKTIQLNTSVVEKVGHDLKIIFTPLHGTANRPVRDGLSVFGFGNVTIVEEQELPDPEFSTVASPNPEEHAAFELAIRYGEKIDADILIGTDPDADRLGVAVKNNEGQYVVLTGNQVGALMLHYILEQKQLKDALPKNGILIKTIVTSEFGRAIASSFGIKTLDTLTGFKFIGEKIKEFEQTGEHTFLFGYEESYGYLIGDFVRDKDAVQAAVFAVEVAAYYKSQGKSLYEGLMELFEKYGYYLESLQSLTLEGKDGAEKIGRIIDEIRANPPKKVAGIAIKAFEDYATSVRLAFDSGEETTIDLPKSNVLKFILEDESWFCVRPSGTEPKAKFYFAVNSDTYSESKEKLQTLEKEVMEIIHELI